VPQKFLDTLRAVVELMRADPKLDVVVVGHADAIGADAYNLALSRRRAEAVAGELRSGGVPEARIRVRGEGEGVPVAPNDTPEGRAKNRRAELTVVERREGDPAPRKAEAAR
jgi:outer membrane protein OmpA-like peptidoglycan-associated protein